MALTSSAHERGRVRKAEAIPDKHYFTIGEVSDLCGEKTHVLRYWESIIPQLAPEKRRGGHRYYTKKDIVLIQSIRRMLREEGYTLAGVKQWLASVKGKDGKDSNANARNIVRKIRLEMESILKDLKSLS